MSSIFRFETSIDIAGSRQEVFAYVADPGRFAVWNSAVESVTPVAGAHGRYLMRRVLPGGRFTNELEIAARAPEELTIRTLSGPTPFVYRYAFAPTDSGTRITLRAERVLAAAAQSLSAAAG